MTFVVYKYLLLLFLVLLLTPVNSLLRERQKYTLLKMCIRG